VSCALATASATANSAYAINNEHTASAEKYTKHFSKEQSVKQQPSHSIGPHAQRIAVIGTGISGMSAAWLLGERHQVTVYEKADRIGGHTNTVTVSMGGKLVPVDTGFIVYNEPCYPNLAALFKHLNVPTRATDMSLAVSLDKGALEYAGEGIDTLFAQRGNLLSPRFWSMLKDLVRFYRQAPSQLGHFGGASIGQWLVANGYGRAFIDDHLMPMAAAIWSAPAQRLLDYPAESFVQFCDNHGLLRFSKRPQWRTVTGGSIEYAKRLTAGYGQHIRVLPGAASIKRGHVAGSADIVGAPGITASSTSTGQRAVTILGTDGSIERYDAVVLATHADEALQLLDDPSCEEAALLGVFQYSDNRAILHSDISLMPRRRKVWSSWNYLGSRGASGMATGADELRKTTETETLCLTYWMNRLQHLDKDLPLFVTLNPAEDPAQDACHYETQYAHPIFNEATLQAQRRLWSLQGQRATWYCGSYFGAGFHEDGLQAGLAVAEQLGGVARPWQLAQHSDRIYLPDSDALPSPVPAWAGLQGGVAGGMPGGLA
jgi:predicted NAD/FAD-binding protein